MAEQRVFYKAKAQFLNVAGFWDSYSECFDEYIDALDWAQKRTDGRKLHYKIWYVVEEKHPMTEWIDGTVTPTVTQLPLSADRD